jgi:hypothetical protein
LRGLTPKETLQFLNLKKTQVTDLSTLMNLGKLEKLYVPKELLEHESTLALRESLPKLEIRGM